MSLLDILSILIGLSNPLSALLVGPFLARRIGERRARIAQGWGWALLATGQTAFLVFGIVSALPGFRWIQPFMIPIAALNFWMWRKAARLPAGAPTQG